MSEQRHEDCRVVPDERHQHEHLLQAAEGSKNRSTGKIRTINCAIKHCSRINGIEINPIVTSLAPVQKQDKVIIRKDGMEIELPQDTPEQMLLTLLRGLREC